VSCTPERLPLAGSPEMVLGDEVALDNGYADVRAVGRTGRLALIEVKLRGRRRRVTVRCEM